MCPSASGFTGGRAVVTPVSPVEQPELISESLVMRLASPDVVRYTLLAVVFVVSMGCLLRVLPSLPTGPDDLSWDSDQQETPDSPATVLGPGLDA